MKRWLIGLLLVSFGALASPHLVPIYDGVGTDKPYRYVGRSPAPTTATDTVKVGTDGAQGIAAQTGETGPQAILNTAGGAVKADASTLTVTVTPVVADGAVPRGTIDSNAYRITTSSPVTFVANAGSGYLYLRAAVMTKPAPVLVHRDTPTSGWTEVHTDVQGRDNLVTTFNALGDYAVVRLPGAKPLSQGGGLTGTRLVFLIGGVLLLIVVTVLVLRRPRDEDLI